MSASGVTEDKLARWATWALVVLIVLPLMLFVVAGLVEWAFACPGDDGSGRACLAGGIGLAPLLFALRIPLKIVQDLWSVLAWLQLAWAVLACRWIGRRVAGQDAGRDLSLRRRWSMFALAAVLGFGPFVGSAIADAVAGSLGCYVNEHGAYTRAADVRACLSGTADFGPVLHGAHMGAMLFILTWPAAIVAIYLAFSILRTLRSNRMVGA